MAGYANSKQKLAAAQEELAELRKQLASCTCRDKPKPKRVIRREYDETIIDELIEWSDEGRFLDECYAAWGIDAETFGRWCEEYVELREALGPARARARAAMLRTLREALRTRTAFPTSLADRIIAMVEREHGQADASADGLVRIDLCPNCAATDAQSAAEEREAVDIARLGETS